MQTVDTIREYDIDDLLDDMHLAKNAFLQDIVIMFKFHMMDSTNPFLLILARLPHLHLNHHRPLLQRIIMRYQIRKKKWPRIEQRMKQAEAKHSIFTPVALPFAKMPRVGDMPFIWLPAKKKGVIAEEMIRMAVEEIGACSEEQKNTQFQTLHQKFYWIHGKEHK